MDNNLYGRDGYFSTVYGDFSMEDIYNNFIVSFGDAIDEKIMEKYTRLKRRLSVTDKINTKE